jgi:hypothetical protein
MLTRRDTFNEDNKAEEIWGAHSQNEMHSMKKAMKRMSSMPTEQMLE